MFGREWDGEPLRAPLHDLRQQSQPHSERLGESFRLEIEKQMEGSDIFIIYFRLLYPLS